MGNMAPLRQIARLSAGSIDLENSICQNGWAVVATLGWPAPPSPLQLAEG